MSTLIPGWYICVRGGGFWGNLIRRITASDVAHVIVYTGPQPNGYDAIEAEPGGVRPCHVSDYSADSSWVCTDPLTELESAGMAAQALRMVGTPYGYVADFFIGLRRLGAWIPNWVFKTKWIVSHQECAQTADYIALCNGVHYFADGRPPGSVSPADLRNRPGVVPLRTYLTGDQ